MPLYLIIKSSEKSPIPPKIRHPNSVTLFGIVILVSDSPTENAPSPIDSTLLGMPVRDRGLAYAQFMIFLRTDSQLRETIRGSGLLVNPSVTSCVRRSRRVDTSPPLGETTRIPEFYPLKNTGEV